LQHHTDAARAGCIFRRATQHADRSRVRPCEPEQHVDRGRLARAVRPEQRDDLAGVNGQIHLAHRVNDAFLRSERLRDPAQIDNG
jgi:hypothetical protein